MRHDWLAGGSLSWSDGNARNTAAVIVLLAVIGFVVGLLWLLASVQAGGEAPEFTCNPENHPYTTRECAP